MNGWARMLVGGVACAMAACGAPGQTCTSGQCGGGGKGVTFMRLDQAEPAAKLPASLDLPSLPLLEDLPYAIAKEKARKASRILMVFWCKDEPTSPRWTFLACKNSLSVRAYIKWHAVAIWQRELSPELASQVCALFPGGGSSVSPAVLIVRDGVLDRVIGPDIPLGRGGGGASSRRPCDPMGIAWNPNDRFKVPQPIRVLYQTDVGMDCIAATDPVWMEIHKRDNPEPKPPPEREPANTIQDELSPIVYDPRPEEKIGTLDRLDEARRLMKSGDMYRATGVYTWLWERGAKLDPAFRPAQLSALAQDLDVLMEKRSPALEKFTTIRQDRNERLPWAEYGQMHEWFVLNGVTRNAEETVAYLDYFTNDLDEGGMIPPADAKAYSLLSLRESFVRAWEVPAEPVARVKRIADRINPKFQATVNAQERAEYGAFAKQYLLDEGCRLYTACLIKGDDVTAQQIAEIILKARNDHVARLSLVVTALAADPAQARPIHERWLAEAEAASGVARPDLHNRLTLGVREPSAEAMPNGRAK